MKTKRNNNLKDSKSCTTSSDGGGCHGKFHINRKTLPLKVTLFLCNGAMSAILPYLTIHMKDIGMSLSEIAIIYAVLPITAFLGAPIIGFMADKLGDYKTVLIVATVINGASHTLLMAVPKYSEIPLYENPECSERVTFNSTSDGVFGDHLICQTNYTIGSGEVTKVGNKQLTFWLYFVIRIVGNIFMNACFSLLDATTLAIVKANKGAEYGRERILCVIGSAVLSPMAGLLVDAVSAAKGYTDYSSAFYLADVMLCLNVLGYVFMKLDVEEPSKDMWRDATKLLNYPEVAVFLIMIFIMGNMWGFVEAYLFVFLDELNAPKYLLGMTLTIGSLVSVPFLYGAEVLVQRVGRVNIIAFSFLVYFVRFLGYSYIPNPFWCFPFEAMEAITLNLMWVAAATYCAVLAPKGLLGTLTGVMGSLHYGLGKGSGAFIGGFVINMSTNRLAFRYFGVFGGAMGLIYFVINKVWLEGAIQRRHESENQAKLDAGVLNEQKQAMLGKQHESNVRSDNSGHQVV